MCQAGTVECLLKHVLCVHMHAVDVNAQTLAPCCEQNTRTMSVVDCVRMASSAPSPFNTPRMKLGLPLQAKGVTWSKTQTTSSTNKRGNDRPPAKHVEVHIHGYVGELARVVGCKSCHICF